jgi:hypothetical protein
VKSVDALTDYFERAVRVRGPAQIIDGWRRGDESARDMCKAFAEIFVADVTKGDSGKWMQGASKLVELGVTRAELVAVREVARAANGGTGATLTHPGAVYEWVKGIRMRQPVAQVPAPSPELVALTGGRRIVGWREVGGAMAPVYAGDA